MYTFTKQDLTTYVYYGDNTLVCKNVIKVKKSFTDVLKEFEGPVTVRNHRLWDFYYKRDLTFSVKSMSVV